VQLDNAIILCIAGLATFGVITRPLRIPEYFWAVLGAAVLVAFGLLPWREAAAAAGKGTDVYLFLVGMMLLSEVARQEGLFDWLAMIAVRHAKASAKRLFLIVYGVGTLVTVFLSNDATAVVLTPAVYAAAILVEGVQRTGILRSIASMLHQAATADPRTTSLGAGAVVAFASNLLNNLPTGLVAATVIRNADVPVQVTSGLLIGVDLGPNLSVTGSLATILWLIALRREGEAVTALQFLKLGMVVMPPALLTALLAMMAMP
jgi:Na+/H+ antiporter NhaD/arsenite permease-like protein